MDKKDVPLLPTPLLTFPTPCHVQLADITKTVAVDHIALAKLESMNAILTEALGRLSNTTISELRSLRDKCGLQLGSLAGGWASECDWSVVLFMFVPLGYGISQSKCEAAPPSLAPPAG